MVSLSLCLIFQALFLPGLAGVALGRRSLLHLRAEGVDDRLGVEVAADVRDGDRRSRATTNRSEADLLSITFQRDEAVLHAEVFQIERDGAELLDLQSDVDLLEFPTQVLVVTAPDRGVFQGGADPHDADRRFGGSPQRVTRTASDHCLFATGGRGHESDGAEDDDGVEVHF